MENLKRIIACLTAVVWMSAGFAFAQDDIPISERIAEAERKLDGVEGEMYLFFKEIGEEARPHEMLAKFGIKVGQRIPQLDSLTAISAISRDIERFRNEVSQDSRLGPDILKKLEAQAQAQEQKVRGLTERNAVVKVRLQALDKACAQWIVEYNQLRKSDEKEAQDHLRSSIAKFVSTMPKPPKGAAGVSFSGRKDGAPKDPFANPQTTGAGNAYLGVRMENLDRETLRDLGLAQSQGVLINGVLPRGPAGKSGLAKGDIIVDVQGERPSSADQFQRLISSRPPGSSVNLKLVRLDRSSRRWKALDVRVLLEARPAEGITLTAPAAPGFLGVNLHSGTCRVMSTHPDSLAVDLALRSGDLLVELNGCKLSEPDDIPEGLEAAANDGIVRIAFIRDGERRVHSHVLLD